MKNAKKRGETGSWKSVQNRNPITSVIAVRILPFFYSRGIAAI